MTNANTTLHDQMQDHKKYCAMLYMMTIMPEEMAEKAQEAVKEFEEVFSSEDRSPTKEFDSFLFKLVLFLEEEGIDFIKEVYDARLGT